MQDVYLARTTRETLEYLEAFRDAIFKLIGTEDEEVWGDGQITTSEERESVGVTIYTIKYKGEPVGKIKSEVFETGAFKISEIK